MKLLLSALLCLCFSAISFAQATSEHGGYLLVADDTADGYVYYITDYLTCAFNSDVDKQLVAKKAMQADFADYLKANYKLVDPATTDQSEWLVTGRRISPKKIYEQKLGNLERVGPGGTIVVVKDYVFNCVSE